MQTAGLQGASQWRGGGPWSRLFNSRLTDHRGFLVTRLLSDHGLVALTNEAMSRHAKARESRVASAVDEDTVRGRPARWLESAAGGPILEAFFASPRVLGLLRRVTGLEWVPSGLQGTYSYYRRAGHFLGLHRDVQECDLALITCVCDSGGPGEGDAGALVLYPERIGETFSAIRESPERGRRLLRLKPGESLILLGGVIPHRLNPVADGQVRIVAPLCFRAESADSGRWWSGTVDGRAARLASSGRETDGRS